MNRSKQKRTGLLIGGVFILLLVFGSCAEAGFDLSGSFFTDSLLRQYEQTEEFGGFKYAGGNALRLNIKYLSGSNFKAEGSFDLLLLYGDYAAAAGQNRSLLASSETRKLYFSVFSDQATFTLGRQIINYGVGYIFSPIDCFSAVELQDIGLSRKGSDIARIQIPLGDLAGAEGVTTLPGGDHVSAVKIFGNLWGYDLSLTGLYKKALEEGLLGFTFKGDLFGIGVHGELVDHYGFQSGKQYLEGMTGADYSFYDGKLLLMTEYYYNGDPVDPNSLTPEEILALNRTFFGAHYIFAQANYTFDEIRSLGINAIYNPREKNWLGTLQFSYNILQNTDLLLYTRYYKGDINGIDSATPLKAELGARVEVKF